MCFSGLYIALASDRIWFIVFSGEKGFEGFKRASEVEIIGRRAYGQTPNDEHSEMHANTFPRAISDQFKEDKDFRGKSGTAETTFTETCKRTCELTGYFS